MQGAVSLAIAMGAAEEDAEILLPLCQAAEAELRARLRTGITPEACGSAFLVAVAWLAMDGLEAAGGRVERFSVGDLTVDTSGSRSLRQRAEELMRPYIMEIGFAFMGVDG